MTRASSPHQSAADVKRLAALKDPGIVVDDGAPAWTPEMFARAVIKRGLSPVPPKTLLSLRVDSDVWLGLGRRGVVTDRG